MIDAHDLQQRILDAWRDLCKPPSATRITTPINDVPVYISIDGELHTVKNMRVVDNKILLDI